MSFRCVSKWLGKKIKSMLFPFAVIVLVAVISYYIGSSMRGTNPDQQSIPTSIVEIEHSVLFPKAIMSKRQLSSRELRSVEVPTGLAASELTPQDLIDRQLEDLQDYYRKKQDILRSRRLSKEQHNAAIANMQAILDNQENQLRKYYTDKERKLRARRLPKAQHNAAIANMQADSDAKKYAILQVRQQLDTIQKLINKGAITPEAGNEAMWRLVLPERTHEALFPK